MTWQPPASPDSKVYSELVAYLEGDGDRDLARAVAEADYYFFNLYMASFRGFKIQDPAHEHRGGLWVREPWVFDRCRELQYDADTDATRVFYNWARFFFKTTLITQNRTLWRTLKQPSRTTGIITHKVEQVGEAIMHGLQDEVLRNRRLVEHWPDVLFADEKDYPLCSKTAFTVNRPAGPREPSASVHGLDKLPDSAHYDDIVFDDHVVAKTVTNPRQIQAGLRQMRRATNLGRDNTPKTYVGTVWDADDPNMQLLNEGYFTRRSHQPGLVHPEGRRWSTTQSIADWTPVLRSRQFFEEKRKELKEYEFACQIMGQPVAKEDQTFDEAWWQRYRRPPSEERQSGDVVILTIDPAGGEQELSDFWAIRAIKLGADRKLYELDLWRERMVFGDALDLIFALVRYWKPNVTFIEEYGSANYVRSIRLEQDHRRFRFELRKFPELKRSKADRIQLLQVAYQRGDIILPVDGFGHGSGPAYIDRLRILTGEKLENPRTAIRDRRDTLEQFRADEYTKWTPVKGSIAYDDMLDNEAWPFQPEVASILPFPESQGGALDYQSAMDQALHKQRLGTTGFALDRVSGWGF